MIKTLLACFLIPSLALFISLYSRSKNRAEIIHKHYMNYWTFDSDFKNNLAIYPLDNTNRISLSLQISKWIALFVPKDFSMRLIQLNDCIKEDRKFIDWVNETGLVKLEENRPNEAKEKFKEHYHNTLHFFFNIELLLSNPIKARRLLREYTENEGYYLEYYSKFSSITYKSNEK